MSRIGVVGTCQVSGIGHALFHLLDEAEIFSFVVGDVYKSERMAEAEKILSECDIVFNQWLPDHVGSLSADSLRRNIENLVPIPRIAFTGFHPDCTEIRFEGKLYQSPMEGYHSLIVAACYSLGLPVDQVFPLFNKFVFKKLGYYEEFARARLYMKQLMEEQGLDIAKEWPDWVASGVFMHTFSHPKSNVLAGIAKLLAVKAGLVPPETPTPGMSIDSLAIFPVWPVYPEIAEALGVKGSYVFKKMGVPQLTAGSHNLLSLREFIRGSYEDYADIPAPAFDAGDIAKARHILSALIFS